MPFPKTVLIIGGGIAGMSCAIGLGRAGVKVEIAEADPDWKVYGAGISVIRPTLRAFQTLGVLEDLKREAYCSAGVRIFTPQGRMVMESPVPPPGEIPGGAGVQRPVLHAILQRHTHAAGATVRLGITAERLVQAADGVDVTFSDGSAGHFDLVIGADGLYSKTRVEAFPEAPSPAFTGQGCWRVTAPRAPEVDRTELYLGAETKAGLNPVSETEVYMFLLEHVPDNPRIAPAEQLPRLRALLEPYGGHMAGVRESLSERSDIVYRPLECLLVPLPWRRGRVVLVGDAVHGTTPHLAAGAGMSVEDAIVLVEELGRAETVEAALDAYGERRYDRCRLVVETSLKLGEIEMARGDPEAHQRLTRATGAALEAVI